MTAQKPLPERMRPDDPDLFLGQSHLASRLKSLMAAERLPSLLFFGPPGCGKSTLALLLARSRKRPYLRLSAPEAGLQHLRRSLNGIEILVLDELHRFSKAQQDFFLPLVESGELTLLAIATSIDALAVGITFAFLRVNIVSAISIIGCTTFVLSGVGVMVGHRFGLRYKKKAEIAGGVILILIGVKILLEHLGILA